MNKTTQLQLRISPADKARLQRRAHAAGLDLSAWIMRTLLPPAQARFQQLCARLGHGREPRSIVLAELHDFLQSSSAAELRAATQHPPEIRLGGFEANYIAAMIEQACAALDVVVPDWMRRIEALPQPYFASELASLRLHLLCSSPPVFRRRNLFVDSTLGARV